ncbi:MAG: hypothetical protein AAB728_04265, partial [Patescibacteria group bacterium]
IPGVKTLLAAYLNPLDLLTARHVIFVKDAVEKAKEIFTQRSVRITVKTEEIPMIPKSPRSVKKKRATGTKSLSPESSPS